MKKNSIELTLQLPEFVVRLQKKCYVQKRWIFQRGTEYVFQW